MEIALVLGLLALAVIAFSTEIVPVDVVGLALIVILVLAGLLSPQEAFSGFGSDTILLLLGLFVMTAAMIRTGVVDGVARWLQQRGGGDPRTLTPLVMIGAASLSAFISNTAATAFFLPVVIGLARRARLSASKLLMPLAFASILTSSVTLLSTSTNVVISGMLGRYDQPPMGMFELAPVGVPIALAGLLYMMTVGMRLLPQREPADLLDRWGIRDYVTEVIVLPNSPLAGKTIEQASLPERYELRLLQVIRGNVEERSPWPQETLQVGDILVVMGTRDDILKVKDLAGLDLKADAKLAEAGADGATFMEGIVLPGSRLLNRTLKGVRFSERFAVQVLAINRRGRAIPSRISEIPLRTGDVLLLQGRRDRLDRVAASGLVEPLGEVSPQRIRPDRAPYAVVIFAVALGLGALRVMPVAIAVMAGAVAMFLTRTITPDEAYQEVDWRVLVLIASLFAFGTAMERSGAAAYLAGHLVALIGPYGPLAVLGGFFALTVLLTQPMSNQAAALVIVPVAMQVARTLDLNPRSLAMMIAVAASCSYLTPLEPSCVMVYGPGRYRFGDFLRVGAPLTLVIFVIAIALVPLVWPVR